MRLAAALLATIPGCDGFRNLHIARVSCIVLKGTFSQAGLTFDSGVEANVGSPYFK